MSLETYRIGHRHHHEDSPLVACPLLDFLMEKGTLSPKSLERILTPRTEYLHNEEGKHAIIVKVHDLALTLVRTYQNDNGITRAEQRTVTQIELKEFMENHLPELEAKGVIDTQGRTIPQDNMLKTLRYVQDLFHSTPITK